MKVPILFIIFNRKDIALESFKQIKKYRPDKLYIAADGPRKNKSGEDIICNETRHAILEQIDWPCELKTLFRNENIGVDFGVYSAINWMFKTEPWGVIIEDDCILSTDFFHLCEIAFPKYASEPKVMHIIANNPICKTSVGSRINFIYYPITWGWATWADKWQEIMNPEMPTWEKQSLAKTIKKYGLIGCMYYRYWKASYRERALLKPWDNIWQYSVMAHNGLSLLPEVNLAINNGIGTSDGTHYKLGEENFYDGLTMGKLKSPFVFPDSITENKDEHRDFDRYFYRLRWFGLKKKLKRLF